MIAKYGKYLLSFLLLINLLTVVAADDTAVATTLQKGVCQIVGAARTILTGVMFGMIVLAAVVYAGGQIMGAETRARANVWATAMFTGAIFAGLIYLIVPIFINTVSGVDVMDKCKDYMAAE